MPRRPISRDLKQRVPFLFYEMNCNVKRICKILGVKKTLVYDTLHYHTLYGVCYNPLANKALACRPRTLDSDDTCFIYALITAHPTLYLDEIQQHLMEQRGVLVSIPTLSRTLRNMKITKKRVSAPAVERDEQRRALYMIKIGDLIGNDPEMLLFTDESAKDERTSQRVNGWAPQGQRCVSRRFFVRGRRYSILPVLSLDGIIAYDIIEGSVTAERFTQFIREMVLPMMNPYPAHRSILVLDNCSIHHSDAVRQLIEEEAGGKLVYLPPYSPDFNPIEQAFSVIKSVLRRNCRDTSVSAMDRAIGTIGARHAAEFFRASGYM